MSYEIRAWSGIYFKKSYYTELHGEKGVSQNIIWMVHKKFTNLHKEKIKSTYKTFN